jgi:hypothetical protein
MKEFEKLYEQTHVANRSTRDRILNEMKQSKRELAKTQAEYDKFKNIR